MAFSLIEIIRTVEDKLKKQEQIALAWEKFISAKGEFLLLDKQIEADWKRIREMGVDFQSLPKINNHYQQLQKSLAEIEPFSEIILKAMRDVFNILSPFYDLLNVKFYDSEGMLIYVLANQATLEMMEEMGVKPGVKLSEQDWGNNGTGTCLFNGNPTVIVGNEHYLNFFKPWVCFDSLIRDATGNIIGGLDLTVPTKSANPLIILLLDYIVKNIEEQIKEKYFRQSVSQKIAQKERFYQQIIDMVPQGIIVFNEQDKVILANQHAVALFPHLTNWENKEMNIKNSPFYNYLGQAKFLDNIKAKIGEKTYLLNLSTLNDDFICQHCKFLVINDVTQLERLEKENNHKEKLALLGTMASGLAHELRNPLTVVKGFLQMDYEKVKLDQSLARHFLISLQEIDRTNNLLSDFLLLSKPITQKEEKINICDIINISLEFCEHKVIENSVKLHLDFQEKNCYVLGNRDKLIQVFLNLLNNSIDAMEKKEEKKITIIILAQQNYWQIKISDTGVGIPEEIIEKLGTPFLTTREKGTGLGFSIANNIIGHHNGRIEVSSNPEGTDVNIFLPIFVHAEKSREI